MKEASSDSKREYASPLPKGWIGADIGTISNIIHYGYTASATNEVTGIKLLRITDIQNNSVFWDDVPFCEIDKDSVQKYLLTDGDLVFARTGATVGKSFLIGTKIPKAVFASYLIRIVLSQHVEKKYVYNYFQSSEYWEQIRNNQLGIGQPNVNSKILSKITLSLPPLPEQHRIVAKIEELFTQLDAGVASLKKAQAQLRRYRQAVLKAAFEGRLTQEWREEHKGEIQKAHSLTDEIIKSRIMKLTSKKVDLIGFDTSIQSTVPDDWMWARLDVVCNKIQDGMHFSPPEQFAHPSHGRYPYITAKNIKDFGIDLTNVTYIDEKYHRDIFQRCNPEYEDVLLIKDGVTTGVVCVNQLKEEFSLLSSVALLKPDKRLLNSRYLKYYLTGPQGFSMIVGQMTGVAIKRIILEKIKKSPIILPSLMEQEIIVSEIEQRLSIADEVDKILTSGLLQAESLRQSILKRAFEGKLVPQDPNDEPASVLLERIKSEKAHNAETKKGKTLQPKSPKRKNKNGN